MQKLIQRGRFLAKNDGSPFFWLGDTAWELFHRLTRADIAAFLACRARQGFTVIQAVALAEFEGLTVPNLEGNLPLEFTDGLPAPGKPLEPYWELVDFAIDEAEKLGLYIALLPTWGDKFNRKWGVGPEIFNAANAYDYALWLAKRYGGRANVI